MISFILCSYWKSGPPWTLKHTLVGSVLWLAPSKGPALRPANEHLHSAGGYHEANHLSSRLHIFTTHFDLTIHSLNHRKSYRSLSTHVPPLPLPSSNCIMTFTHFTFTEIFFKNRSIHKYFLVALNSIPLTVYLTNVLNPHRLQLTRRYADISTFYLYALILKNIWLKLLSGFWLFDFTGVFWYGSFLLLIKLLIQAKNTHNVWLVIWSWKYSL